VINGSVVSEYALSFNGSDEYVDTGFQPDFIHTNATMSFWVKMDNFSGTQIMGCHNDKRFYCGFSSQLAGMGVQNTNNLGSGADLSSYTAVGQWHHICLVADGGTATYYVDGVSRDTMSYTQASASNPDKNILIGATGDTSGAVYHIEGDIDEVGFWDVALDADAVAAVYNSGSPINLNEDKGNYDNSDDIVSWWRMGDSDSGAGDVLTDAVNPTVGAELVTNGSMEADANWVDYSTPVTNERSTEQVRAGTYSRKLVGDTSTGGIQSDNFTSSNGVHEVVFWVYPDTSTTVRIAIRNGVDSGWAKDTSFSGLTQDAWNRCSAYYSETAAGSGAYIAIHNSTAAGTWYLDDVSITKLNGNVGVLKNGPTFVVDNPPNYSNYSVDFDGTDDRISTALIPDFIHTGATLSYWVNLDNRTGSQQMGCYTGSGKNFYLGLNDNNACFSIHDVAECSLDVSALFPTGTWHHLAMVADAGTGTYYLNGIPIDTLSYTPDVDKNPDGYFNIGAMCNGPGDTALNFMEGKFDEVAIFNSALTSAQINDIYNGGVPADLTSLSPLGWWRLGENDSGTGTTITDQGSGENDGTLVSTTTFERSVPAEDATWNNRSLSFNGTNEYITTTANDTLASKSFSFWAKSNKTTGNTVFSHGGDLLWGQGGAFAFNVSSSRPLLYMADGNFRYWDDNSAQDDDAWHHHVVYIEKDALANCKWYVDGAVQPVYSTTTSEAMLAYTTGTRIGRGGTYYFDGELDEFAIFDGELTPAQVLQIYNGGSPADLKEFSPESWWRMGDDDDAGGTTIRDLGVVSTTELVENGEFGANTTGWTAANSATLASESNRLKVTNDASVNHGAAYQEVTVVVGGRYKVTADVAFSVGNATDVQFKLGTSQAGVQYFNSGSLVADTTITEYITATTTSLWIYCQNAGGTSNHAHFDNISVKQDDLVLNGDFSIATTASTWNGSSAVNLVGWTNNSQVGTDHTAVAHVTITDGALRLETNGDYVDISQDIFTVGSVYEYSIELTAVADGSLRMVAGGVDLGVLSTVGVHSGHFTATTATHFYIKRLSGATDVTFDNVSFKQIDANTGTLVNTPTFSTDIP
jgi:hypothetical protein